MAEFLDNLPGSRPATLQQLGEILRGATILSIEPDKARDPDHGGEIVRINFRGGDFLLLVAVPNRDYLLDPSAPTARLQPCLVTHRNTKLVLPNP